MSPERLARVELACQDPHRQRDFFARILGLPPAEPGNALRFSIGELELVLRPRGDALFASARHAEGGALLAFPVSDAPGPAGAPPRLLRVADPEGNVIEFYAPAA
jgi:catechol 2,3-dioxygenase-like lactoylglutathione lyase family enzyme